MAQQDISGKDRNTGGIQNFGFYRIAYNIREVFSNILTNYFSTINSTQESVIPIIKDYPTTTRGETVELLKIYKEWPYEKRSLPFVLVYIINQEEFRLQINNDNLLYENVPTLVEGTTTGLVTYGSALNMTVGLGIGAEDHESRQDLADAVYMCFSHFYRSGYYYTDASKRSNFSFVVRNESITYGGEAEETVDPDSIIYANVVQIPIFVEWQFSVEVDFVESMTEEFVIKSGL